MMKKIASFIAVMLCGFTFVTAQQKIVVWCNGENKELMADSITFVDGDTNGVEYVDLGLPSGNLWATCNVGATKPEEYGDLFAWGEVSQKDTFDIMRYKFYNELTYSKKEYGEWITVNTKGYTKYVSETLYESDQYGCNGFIDNKETLEPEDDVAYNRCGGAWRMPTKEDLCELMNPEYCEKRDNYSLNGVMGWKITSKANGNSIFLPYCGYGKKGSLDGAGQSGKYWSSTASKSKAHLLHIDYGYNDCGESLERYYGCAVRPVCYKKK